MSKKINEHISQTFEIRDRKFFWHGQNNLGYMIVLILKECVFFCSENDS